MDVVNGHPCLFKNVDTACLDPINQDLIKTWGGIMATVLLYPEGRSSFLYFEGCKMRCFKDFEEDN